MDDKPFLTIDEQMALLRRCELHTDSETERILMREGYYSIINGYKTPFIDRVPPQAPVTTDTSMAPHSAISTTCSGLIESCGI